MFRDSEVFWKILFQFQPKNNYCESVVWRKYAPLIMDVHSLGNEKITKDRLTHKDRLYLGVYTCSVRLIRNINTSTNIRIEVEHEPGNDQGQHHAHLRLALPKNISKPEKNDKSEIRLKLQKIFEPLEECPSGYN